jgi:hypothetical protein
MPIRQVIFLLIISAALLLIVIELVRRRRLREEYAWLWLLAAIAAPLVVAGFPLIRRFTRLVGADEPVSILFFLTLIFLMVVNIHYSTKISQLTEQVKNLAQAIALATADSGGATTDRGCTTADETSAIPQPKS